MFFYMTRRALSAGPSGQEDGAAAAIELPAQLQYTGRMYLVICYHKLVEWPNTSLQSVVIKGKL